MKYMDERPKRDLLKQKVLSNDQVHWRTIQLTKHSKMKREDYKSSYTNFRMTSLKKQEEKYKRGKTRSQCRMNTIGTGYDWEEILIILTSFS
jgi:hypothetical protein